MRNKFCTKCFKTFPEGIMTQISGELGVCPGCLEKIKNSTPREYTEDEIRAKYLRYMWGVLEYWEELPNKTEREKMEGFFFTFLSTIDGSSGNLPGFKLIPDAHPDDKEHHKMFGENWYPEDTDIAGSLHERMHEYGPTEDQTKIKELKKSRNKKLKRINKD